MNQRRFLSKDLLRELPNPGPEEDPFMPPAKLLIALFLEYCCLFQMAKPKKPMPTIIMLRKEELGRNTYAGILKLEKSNHPVLAASFELLGEVNSITVTVSLSVVPRSGWTDLVLKTTKLLVC